MKVIFIVGSTATGKSELALRAALHFGGEIVNADSLQVYRSLDIGTAKPSKSERKLAPHHLFDFIEVGKIFTAGDYRQAALEVLKGASRRQVKCLYFVGGSGFYIRALLKGMYDLPKPAECVRQTTEKELSENPDGWAYKRLMDLDRDYANKLSPNDLYRIRRGLEIIYASGKKVSEIQGLFAMEQRENSFPYEYCVLGIELERELLRCRVERRSKKMLDEGLVAEVDALRDLGFRDWPPLSSVGYKEVQRFLDGQIEYENLLPEIVTNTMQLAKKQRTWFRHQLDVEWFDFSQIENAEAFIGRYLGEG